MLTVCHAFGLRAATEVSIPGALPVHPQDVLQDDAQDSSQSVFSVLRGDARLAEGECGVSVGQRQFGPYRIGPEGLLFERPGVARFLCAPTKDRITVDAVPGVPESEVAAFLIATAIPALLWMRGEIVLHGAVAVLPGAREAIALMGASGSGKSMLLQEIVQAGGTVVAEDSFRLWLAEGRFVAAGLPGRIHCRAAGAPLEAEREEYDVPLAQCRASAELSAMVGLETEDDESGRDFAGVPDRLHGAHALAMILRHQHRPRVPELLGLSAGLLPRYSAIVRTVPVYSWEFLRAALRSPGNGGTWRALAGLQDLEGWRE